MKEVIRQVEIHQFYSQRTDSRVKGHIFSPEVLAGQSSRTSRIKKHKRFSSPRVDIPSLVTVRTAASCLLLPGRDIFLCFMFVSSVNMPVSKSVTHVLKFQRGIFRSNYIEHVCRSFCKLYFEHSSSLTLLKKSQYIHDLYFLAYVPCTSPLQRVPTTNQHALPPFVPPFSPSRFSAVAAGHTPKSPLCRPSGCLPHLFTSQQLSLIFLFILKYFVLPLRLCAPSITRNLPVRQLVNYF